MHFFTLAAGYFYMGIPQKCNLNKTSKAVRCCCSVAKSCLTLQFHGLQHARLPCPSLSPRISSNSCPLRRWCHPAISFFVIAFPPCLQSFLASGSFLMSWLFTSGGQSTGASALDTISLFHSFLNLILDTYLPQWTIWSFYLILRKKKKTLVFILMELHEINFKSIDFIIRFLIQKHEHLFQLFRFFSVLTRQ